MHEAAPSTPGHLHTAIDSAAMTAAMMALLIGGSAELVAERSLPSRRWLAVGEHVLGFVAIWIAFGLVASGAVQTMELVLSPAIIFGVLLVIAGIWQGSDRRRRALGRCGRLPVGPLRGWRASRRNLLSGVRDARSCVPGAGLPMLAMAAAPGIVGMTIVLFAHLSEWAPGPQRFAEPRSRRPVPVYFALAAANLFFAIPR
jgi:predicted metal-binding membrane protein